MPKVRTLTAGVSAGEPYDEGDVLDLDKKVAKSWVARGLAEYVSDDPPPRRSSTQRRRGSE